MKGNFSEKEEQEMYKLFRDEYTLFQKNSNMVVSINAIRHFEDRYAQAKADKVNMYIFFKAEREALDKYKEKILKQESQREEKTISDIFERVSKDTHKYRAISIHKNAPDEIQRLVGAMIDFRKDYFVGISYLGKKFREIEINNIYESVVGEMKELCHIKRDEDIPTAFNAYRFRLEIYYENEIESEKANMEILKKVMFFLRKVKQLVIFLDKMSYNNTGYLNKKVPYQEGFIPFDNFFHYLENQANQILKDFRLEEFY